MKITSKKIGGKRVYEVTGYLGVFVDESTGKKKQKNFHRKGLPSSQAAKDAFNEAKKKFQNPTDVSKAPTYRDIYEIWLATYRQGVKASTLNRVLGVFKHHILPSMGNWPITDINWQTCQRVALEWREQVATYRKVGGYASLVFRTAQKMGLIPSNPMALVDYPAKKSAAKKSDNFWTANQLSEFLHTVSKIDAGKRYDRTALFYLLATTGMRKGECLALTWGDINFTAGTVTISKTVTRDVDNNRFIGTPKTKNAYRTISLDPSATSQLKAYKRSQSVVPSASDLIFHNQEGFIMSLMKPNHWMESILKKTDLPRITIHGLRHTFASIQSADNVNAKAVQLQLGHSDIETTLNIYTHLTPDELSSKLVSISDVI